MATIQRPNEAMAQLFWHAPASPIPVNTAVVVGENECVVVSCDGAIVGVIPPGSHWMHPQPFPFLAPSIDAHANVQVELWFVSTANVAGFRNGGPLAEVYDEGLGVACTPRAILEFSLKVTNPTQLVQGVMGQSIDADALVAWIKGQLMNKAKECVAMTVNAGTPVLSPKIAAALSRELPAMVDLASSGLAITQVGNVMVSFSEDDMNALKTANMAKARENMAARAAAAAPPPQHRCTRCGLAHDGGRFCTSCGAPLS